MFYLLLLIVFHFYWFIWNPFKLSPQQVFTIHHNPTHSSLIFISITAHFSFISLPSFLLPHPLLMPHPSLISFPSLIHFPPFIHFPPLIHFPSIIYFSSFGFPHPPSFTYPPSSTPPHEGVWRKVGLSVFGSVMFNFGSVLLMATLKKLMPDEDILKLMTGLAIHSLHLAIYNPRFAIYNLVIFRTSCYL